MGKTVIRVEDLSKRYRLGLKEKQADTLAGQVANLIKSPWQNLKRLQALNKFREEDESVFWALKDINFEVEKGEVLGIIGKNGAGKSTLLKILSQITDPTSGKIKIHGRVASLLEVGTGFHPELSGRENIYMNGTILGMTRKEIDRKLDEIIDFSGVEKFIDTPVKFYSSGMKVRLGFSVAAHLEPEILIIDEVLSVGDYEFQAKCLGKMEEVSKKQGRTVLFVSHHLPSVKTLCSRAILLSNGELVKNGNVDETVNYYLNTSSSDELSGYYNQPISSESVFDIYSVCLKNKAEEITDTFEDTDEIVLEINYSLKENLKGARMVFQLIDMNEVIVFASTNQQVLTYSLDEGNYSTKCFIPDRILRDGQYKVRIHAGQPGVDYLLHPKDYLSFRVLSSGLHGSTRKEKWPGIIAPQLFWNNEKID
ncbi:MAG: ABC transporter ATP-binding protein [Algoriphagus sp.]|uniref:ABC transporter ATP-binding protein n=1 Tax=Algoriphagus sp. TaxID=1872435 RepID=UPI00178D289E|nr:ABC transporter ATP-binding protein [Algoriphagus sp.]NVJ86807.1 ABC transporter ATP-binding protein [Algoriphagus sp.]